MTLLTFAPYEQSLKRIAFVLGVFSTISVVQGWQIAAMLFSLPFCLIWIYCAWLHSEPQLKNINIIFTALYIYGIGHYFLQ